MIEEPLCTCPDCGGQGEYLIADIENGYSERLYMCDMCNGLGQVYESDMVMMKLQGTF